MELWSLLREKRVLVVADAVASKDQIFPLITSGWFDDSRGVITTCIEGLMSIELGGRGVIQGPDAGDQEELVYEVIAESEG
ncbi:hypothetical protein R1flu_001987 [Riccia fluitans]|uniref:Uncharacterized protein n=1 Tax=Riccia fluitans TaxID=41844 RepID=A0ABD1Y870_9MARC